MGLEFEILLPAFTAGLLIIATHVPLGREVLKRGIIFIDLAVAQFAVLGVIVARTLEWTEAGAVTQFVAFGSAIAGSIVLHACERRWPEILEAIIGTAFVLTAATVLLLLSQNPHGGEQLQELLSGQILWASWKQVVYVAILYSLVLIAWSKLSINHGIGFYLLFAITVTASVQLVGVLLVFASLVVPALLVRKKENRPALIWAYSHSAIAYLAGFVTSVLFDLPTGPTIVWTLVVVGIGINRLPRLRAENSSH